MLMRSFNFIKKIKMLFQNLNQLVRMISSLLKSIKRKVLLKVRGRGKRQLVIIEAQKVENNYLIVVARRFREGLRYILLKNTT